MSKISRPSTRLPTRAAGDRLELEYLWGGMAVYQPGESFGPRILSDYELVWIMSGSAVYRHEDQSHLLPAGSLLLTHPGFNEKYEWDRRQPTRHAFLHFAAADFPSDWGPPGNWPLLRSVSAPGAVSGLFQHLLSSWAHNSSHRCSLPPRWVSSAMETLLDLFLRPSPVVPQPHWPPPVQRALAWSQRTLAPTPGASIQLPDLAKAASVSGKHLCRLFEKHLRLSPMQAVRLLRLERAMDYLERSNLSMKQIADRCGFASPYHFSRVFRQTYGRPPSTVRRELLRGLPPPRSPLSPSGWQAQDWGV